MFNYLPRVHEDILWPAYIDLTNKPNPPDIKYLEFTKENSPGLFKAAKIFINLSQNDISYRQMMACLVLSLKLVDNQIEINKLEDEKLTEIFILLKELKKLLKPASVAHSLCEQIELELANL